MSPIIIILTYIFLTVFVIIMVESAATNQHLSSCLNPTVPFCYLDWKCPPSKYDSDSGVDTKGTTHNPQQIVNTVKNTLSKKCTDENYVKSNPGDCLCKDASYLKGYGTG